MRSLAQVACITVTAALMIGMVGVASAQSPAASPAAPTLAGTDWGLVSTGSDGTQTPVPAGITASLQINGTLAGGSSGCNRYMTSVTSMDPGLTFGEIATTMMACPDAQMTFEQQYLAALATVADYSIADQELSLLNGSGGSVLVYQAAAVATLEGLWVVTQYNNGRQGTESPPEGSALTADFAPDGTVSGNGGCNSFNGGYSYAGDTIAIGPLMNTRMSCGDAANGLEQQYLTALQNATVWSILNGSLELRDDSGALQVAFGRP